MLVTDDVEVNLNTILKFIAHAARRKCDIVCFPEVCLVNNEKHVVPIEPHLKAIQSQCKKVSIWCIFGSYQKERSRIRNFAYLIDNTGLLTYRYAKVHLWKTEVDHGIVPGRTTRTIQTRLGKIGLIICFDFAFPSFVRKLALQGAEVIFCPSFMVDYAGWEEMLRTMPLMRAFENTAYFVYCDAVTVDKRTAAMSCIAGPEGIISSIDELPGMIVETLDLKRIRRLRDDFRILRGTSVATRRR